MRGAFLFGIGVASGAIAVVLLFTLSDAFGGGGSPAPLVGNASLVLDGKSLAGVVAEGLPPGENGLLPDVEVSVRSDGHLEVGFPITATGAEPKGSVSLNPTVRDGALIVDIDSSDLVGITAPEVAAALVTGLTRRLEAVAGAREYRLLTIATVASRMTLEITY